MSPVLRGFRRLKHILHSKNSVPFCCRGYMLTFCLFSCFFTQLYWLLHTRRIESQKDQALDCTRGLWRHDSCCLGQRCCLGAPRLLLPPLCTNLFPWDRQPAGQFRSCTANNKSVLIAESLLGSLFNLQTHTLITACVLWVHRDEWKLMRDHLCSRGALGSKHSALCQRYVDP